MYTDSLRCKTIARTLGKGEILALYQERTYEDVAAVYSNNELPPEVQKLIAGS
ncbi:hypothetical protein [Streptomyces sp. NPDC057280]|uniref:hypothetical protein n=1 Tax=Streptomyces sp. NPDC057280 TaxID=3346081 RepID=UPI003636426D